MNHGALTIAAILVLVGTSRPAFAEDDSLARPVDRAAVLAAAVRDHPALRAADEKARATSLAADAEGRLPPPEAMVQVWQVPIERPYAIGDGQMIMFGVGQSFPAPGARGARERAGHHVANGERAMVSDRARLIRRDAEHAFADYVEATARHRIHVEHRSVADRALSLARARHAGAGALSDVAQAEVELARVESDVVTDGTRIEGARARLNVLLGRDAYAPLGPPVFGAPEVAAWDLRTSAAKAREARPELTIASAQRDARNEAARAAEQESKLPSFNIAALYFAPTSPMPNHGYGVNASMSLPWLWGEASGRRDAQRQAAVAASSEAHAAQIPIDTEVATAEANVRASGLRLQALQDRALPASHRAFDIAWAGYESARTDILALLTARRSVVDVESEIVVARASLDHALAELDAAVGAPVPRRALGALDPKVLDDRSDHGR
jgi:outer membrane protein, heavy metal efflux system